MTIGWMAAGIAIAVWGVTFDSTRVLLEEFSALEINIARFGLAWVALACAAEVPRTFSFIGEARLPHKRADGTAASAKTTKRNAPYGRSG